MAKGDFQGSVFDVSGPLVYTFSGLVITRCRIIIEQVNCTVASFLFWQGILS